MPDPIQPGVAEVRRNETLSDVASRFGKSLDVILALNPQFDPATKAKAVTDWDAEKAKSANGESGRNIHAIQAGELIRVAELEDTYFVTEQGLTGAVFDEALVTSSNNRLMALRRYADGGGETGIVDDVVTPEEARHFMQWSQTMLAKQRKAGPEVRALDAFEQKTLIELGQSYVKATDTPGYNAMTRQVFDLAPQSFEVQNWPEFTVNNLHSSMLNQAFTTSFVPVALAMSPGFVTDIMQNLDSSSSVAVKAFTPNANLLKVTGDAKTNMAWLKQFKIHNWVAGRSEIAVSRVYVGESGNQTRTATISAALGYQPEAVFDANVKSFDFRSFVTMNHARQVQYQITTNPDRLSDILAGKIAPPNPYDPSTMLPGDVVTLTSGAINAVELEQRILFNPARGLTKEKLPFGNMRIPETGEVKKESDGLGGENRVGLDFKFDHATFNGDNRLVVRKLKDNHVQVFHGSSLQEMNAVGVGVIANPDLGNASRKVQNTTQGAFFRLMPQLRDVEVNNTFHFAELDLDDKRPGGGKALYERVMATGEVPTAQSLQPIRGVIQHGTLDYQEAQQHFTLQATLYSEKPKLIGRQNLPPGTPPAKTNAPIPMGKFGNTDVFTTNDWANVFENNSAQVLQQNTIDIMSSVSTYRHIDVRHVYPKLKAEHGAVDHDDAVNPETHTGSGAQKTTLQHTQMGGVRLTEANEVNSGTGEQYAWPMLISQRRGDKASVERALEAMIADQAAGKAPLFEDFVVTGRDQQGQPVEYRGAEALAYLKSHSDRSNDLLWGKLPGRDTLPIRIVTIGDQSRDNSAKIADFTNQYLHDYKAANSDEDLNTLQRMFAQTGQQAVIKAQVTATMLGSEYLNIQDGGLSKISIERAGSGHEIRKALTAFDLGEWIDHVQRYRSGKGERINGTDADPYYPVRIMIDVPY